LEIVYAKKAEVSVPCLEDWEKQMDKKIVRLAFENDIENKKNGQLDHPARRFVAQRYE
jgi:hypothetical protein